MSRTKTTFALLLAAALLGPLPHAHACTTFAAEVEGAPIVAKSFDWHLGEGWVVHNERGRTRFMMFPRPFSPTVSWTAQYASLTFTTVGPGFPVSGMNEAGLTLESLVDLSRTAGRVPEPGALTGLEFVQYALDNFAGVDDLADFARAARIDQLGVALHFFACERSGRCIVVEGGDRPQVTQLGAHRTRALANDALRADREAQPSMLSSVFGLAPRPGSSAARYGTVTRGAHAVHSIDDAFRLLDDVAGARTRWQLVWALGAGRVHFRDHGRERAVVTFALDQAPCEGAPRVLSVGGTAVASSFHPFGAVDAARVPGRLAAQLGGPARRLAPHVVEAIERSQCGSVE